jgi:hypothetical protein
VIVTVLNICCPDLILRAMWIGGFVQKTHDQFEVVSGLGLMIEDDFIT